MESSSPILTPVARFDIFGYPPTPAQVEVIPRTRQWRISHALIALALSWGITPVVALVPPHIPWAVAGFFVGPFLARRYLKQHYTLVRVNGNCPNCGATIQLSKETPLRMPHPFVCESCHNAVLLEVDVAMNADRR